ncbi:proline-rich protein 12-like [Medicago truncatula]|uniref:proline-rich protein 12-like n=1 Tax=Medicago truncatula TaxID=3880 RepID=UPI000D2F208F|nr:proline-rich protein 12-like [Medicago truncatula]
MPPKPSNPTTKDLEDALQTVHSHFEEILQTNTQSINQRFVQVDQTLENQLGLLHTRLDNQASLQDARFETITSQLTTLIQNSTHDQPPTAQPTVTMSSSNTPPPLPPPGYEQILIHTSPSTPPFQPYISTTTLPLGSSIPTPHATLPIPILTTSTRPTTQPVSHTPPIPPFPPPYYNNPLYYLPQQSSQPVHPSMAFYNNSSQQAPPLPPFFPCFPVASSPQLPPTNSGPSIRSPKLDLIPFDGSDPLEWLFQAEQFFCFYQIPMESRVHMSSFYMKGEALSWFKWMFQNNLLHDWLSFTKALELRFGPSTYANHQAELFKLRQDGSVSDYQAQFEKLGNRVLGLPADAILNCFISGLSPEIRNEMAIQRPLSISQAIGLAKLIEAKLKDSKPKYNRPISSSQSWPRTTTPNNPQKQPPSPSFPALPRPNASTPPKIPIRRLNESTN